jgi:hypothetical protein
MIARLKAWAAAGLALLVLGGYAFRQMVKRVRTDVEQEALQDDAERLEKGRAAVRDGRGDSPADRLRRNTDARR